MVEFAGYEMPLWYSSISEEHLAVRNYCGVLDISHMGRLIFEGKGSAPFLDYLVPSNVLNIAIGKGVYTVLCNDSGGIIDDIIIFRISGAKYFVVVNATNLQKDLDWFNQHNKLGVKISDMTAQSAMIAVQGPKAVDVLGKSLSIDATNMQRFAIAEYSIDGALCLISRSGYTGEDGFEIVIMETSYEDSTKALGIWDKLRSYEGLKPCGLGARDTLRLEAGLCLYGQDLNDSISPIEAGLAWTVSKDKGDYIAKSIIAGQMQSGTRISRIGIEMVSQGIPRKGYTIYKGEKIGEITSGTFSPLLKKGIAMGYVPSEFAKVGENIEVEIRGQRATAKIVKPPFYDQKLYGWKRARKD